MLSHPIMASDFKNYPPQGQGIATEWLDLWRQLPLAFLPIVLRELIGYDWMMPMERSQIEAQIRLMGSLSIQQLAEKMRGFAALRLNPELEGLDWINHPATFIQDLTAWLWSTHQMDAFHSSAESFNAYLANAPPPKPAMPRFGIVILGQGADPAGDALFQKLRPSGTFFKSIRPDDGVSTLLAYATMRAGKDPAASAFTLGISMAGAAMSAPRLTTVSYSALDLSRSRRPGVPHSRRSPRAIAERKR